MRLEFDGLVKRFGNRTVLDGLTFAVRAGELFGFCGANGSGKTTLMRIALGVVAADRGTVRWNGAPLDRAVRRRIGYLPEERGLYAKLRPVDQLTYFGALSGLPPAVARQRAMHWLERLAVDAGPNSTVEELSLGNQQRVQLAAAVIHDPEIVLLDEPFSGLDPAAVDRMAEVLYELTGRGVPVLFSSHQLGLVERLCDRVGIIRDGRLVAGGTVGELRGRAGSRWLRIRIAGAPTGWPGRLPGVRVREADGPTAEFELDGSVSSQAILAAAAGLGSVEYFGWREASLAEIYREVLR
jgi:ABC-2 type transport system ATP-binding protein